MDLNHMSINEDYFPETNFIYLNFINVYIIYINKSIQTDKNV